MNKVTVGGVPEHFNYPWHYGIEKGLFKEQGLEVEWHDYPGGTGVMKEALKENTLDIAVILTEGIVADILKGNPSRILQVYVESPLTWGIHIPGHLPFSSMEEVKGKRYAISRTGSGSHLMAFVDAERRGWNPDDLEFVTVQNLDGARTALKKETAYIFFWEKFTTQPYVDNGEFKRIDECPTPWPCFVLAASEKALSEKREAINKTCKTIIQSCENALNEKKLTEKISNRYNLDTNEVYLWLEQTYWARKPGVSAKMLNTVQETLKRLHIVSSTVNAEALIC